MTENKNSNNKFLAYYQLLFCIMLLFFSACGGGSQGTGTVRFQGKILSVAGVPLSGAIVTVTDTTGSAASTTTDTSGNYTVSLPDNNTEFVEVEVEDSNISTRTTVSVPQNPVVMTVTIDLEVHEAGDNDTAEVTHVEATEIENENTSSSVDNSTEDSNSPESNATEVSDSSDSGDSSITESSDTPEVSDSSDNES